MKDIVIFDGEYTSWEGSRERRWSEDWEHREVVQIAGIRINPETFEQIGEPLDIIIKPRINSQLSDYFINLTSITNEDIEKRGIDFLDAYKKFQEYIKDCIIWSFADDCPVINESITLYKLENELEPLQGEDIRAWAISIGIDVFKNLPDGREFSSGTFAEAIGAPFKTEAHYALNDALSIQAAVKYLVEEKGIVNPFTKNEKHRQNRPKSASL